MRRILWHHTHADDPPPDVVVLPAEPPTAQLVETAAELPPLGLELTATDGAGTITVGLTSSAAKALHKALGVWLGPATPATRGAKPCRRCGKTETEPENNGLWLCRDCNLRFFPK